MTRAEARAVLEEAGGRVSDGPAGLEWGPLRLRSGGGIAGHLGEWWITAPGEPDFAAIGPMRRQRELRAALRGLVLDCVRLGDILCKEEPQS